jgi:hypothetical protein
MKRWVSTAFVLFVTACSPTRGCNTATFTLAPDSPVPVWFSPPSNVPRESVTVTMDSWSGPFGRSATFRLWDANGQEVAEVVAEKDGTEPLELDRRERPQYPLYELATHKGTTEVIEHREMGTRFYVNRDPKLRARLEEIARGR